MKKSSLSIPPLPSSKRAKPTIVSIDKENINNAIPSLPNRTMSLSKSLSTSTAPRAPRTRTRTRTSQTDSSSSSYTPSQAASPLNMSISSTSITTPMRSSSRVLRYNETIDEFFCLNDKSKCSHEHLELCQDVANDRDGSANDLGKWRAILQMVANQNQTVNVSGQDLIKLHKRAVSRFMSFNSSTASTTDQNNIFHIWLLYAKTLSKFGSRDDASKTFRHIELKKLGEKEADFFICLAEFELNGTHKHGDNGDGDGGRGNLERAIGVLKNGCEKGAEPKERLDRFLNQLMERRTGAGTGTGTGDIHSNGNLNQLNSVVSKKDDDIGDKPMAMDAKGKSNLNGVPKLNSLSLINKRRLQIAQRVEVESKSSGSGIPRGEGTFSRRAGTVDNKANVVNPQGTASHEAGATSLHLKEIVIKGNDSEKVGVREMSTSSSLLSKKRRFGGGGGGGAMRGGFGGGAQRISTQADMDKTVEEDEDEDLETEKTDISYLLNWNPTGPSTKAAKKAVMEDRAKKETSAVEKAPSSSLNTFSRYRPMMEKIEESTKEGYSKNGSFRSNHSHSTSSGNSGSIHSQCSNGNVAKSKPINATERSDNQSKARSMSASFRSEQNITNDTKTDGTNATRNNEDNSNGSSVASNKSRASAGSYESKYISGGNGDPKSDVVKINKKKESPAASQEQIQEVHPEFLNIIRNKNIITVNNSPYVKLGVIGKGGSCKVYRTLSTDRKIVAIKMVKIGGMKRKSIEGYANEIALLRRLRGNHAIIQLYDSEVDFKRKAILLVMEPGEVDLNHVLQQQGLQRSKGESRASANMNFIRLTWQQMLSAVHCIHEERIIHGDLKPANFLFVKGVLKLIDFGIAKAIQSDDTTNIYRESQVGTLNYMSPESILDSGTCANGTRMKCGKPSDVWSLGCILYQMCYSKTPFADLTMFPKLQAIVNPNHEIEFPNSIDKAAIDAIKLCLKRKPEDRAPIVGKNGLLNGHWFLNSDSSG